tara:strand:- start:453 stop:794 length:342 start_codon:yes stop_codon:yes gene_type:complete
MTTILLCLSMSGAWAQDAAAPTPLETTISHTLDGLITQQSMNIGITTLKMKQGSAKVFQMEGNANDKASIKALIDALEAEPSTVKPYLVSLSSGTIDGEPKDLFVMTAHYAGK